MHAYILWFFCFWTDKSCGRCPQDICLCWVWCFAGGMALYKICTDQTPWLGQSCRVTLFLWNYPRNSSTCACIVVAMQSVVGDSYPKLILWNIVYSGSLCFSCVRTCDRFLTLISILGLPTLMLLNHSWGGRWTWLLVFALVIRKVCWRIATIYIYCGIVLLSLPAGFFGHIPRAIIFFWNDVYKDEVCATNLFPSCYQNCWVCWICHLTFSFLFMLQAIHPNDLGWV